MALTMLFFGCQNCLIPYDSTTWMAVLDTEEWAFSDNLARRKLVRGAGKWAFFELRDCAVTTVVSDEFFAAHLDLKAKRLFVLL